MTQPAWPYRLLANNRFWILTSGVIFSVAVAGFVQLLVPSGTLQIIRIGQVYGFAALTMLYVAMLASPLTKAYPNIAFKEGYLHARRAIGVLAFYFAFLHVYLTFFKQLGGFAGIGHYNSKYGWALLLGVTALGILFILAATSIDWAVKTFGFKNWKLLHRLVYLAGLSILIHIALIGSHFARPSLVSGITAVGILVLLWLEGLRIFNVLRQRGRKSK